MTIPSLRATDDTPSSPLESSLAPVVVRQLERKDEDRWDRFVFAQPGGTFFHQMAWMRVVERTFGHQPQYAYAERLGSIVGIVPTFLVSNWMVGRALISSPLAAYGGICADDPEAEIALLQFLKAQAKKQGVDYLELRNPEGEVEPEFVANPLYSDFSMPLAGNSDQVLNSLPKDIRYMIRKAAKADLQIKRGPEYLEVFYRLFAVNMHRLGTPVFPRALFANLLSEFGKQIDVLVVYAGSQPVASAFSFLFRDTMHPYYIGGLPVARDLAANNFLWWELIKFAVEAGMKTFDFGRSKKGTGAYAFKKKWNPQIKDLKYQVFLVQRRTAPNFSPANPKFKAATQIWSRLPLWLANTLGPKVVSWFP
jgi:FemAB-related protein (PEP-CTERM system-associated)